MWHIIGDALGWRRGWLDGKGRGPPAQIQRSLLHERVVDRYDDALADLLRSGYAMWDVLCESEREGSLDGAIKNAVPADVRGLCTAYPSIRRVCFASGLSTATFFKRHFKSWLRESGAFHVAPDALSQRAFGTLVPLTDSAAAAGAIELVVMESVSPAYVPRVSYGDAQRAKRQAAFAEAGYDPELGARRASAYAWKRQQWFEHCFAPVLPPAERPIRFGGREGDFLDDATEAEVQQVDGGGDASSSQ